MKKIVKVEVEGIDCEKCVAKIKTRLLEMGDVHQVNIINYRYVILTIDPGSNIKRILEVIEEMGYRIGGKSDG